MYSFAIGDIDVYHVEEWQGPFASPLDLFADFDPVQFRSFCNEIPLDYYQPETDSIYAFLQSWILKTGELVVLFDTGAGNHKERPGIPVFGQLETRFLENLKQAGFEPKDIDIVICSHLHIDHVGWNTTLQNDEWVPTFPNAQYLFSRIERDYWDPAGKGSRPSTLGAQVNTNVYEDSVQPILDAGRVSLVHDGYQVAPGLTLNMHPGHTPGHLVLNVERDQDRAMFVGDILHHPAQIYRPDWNSVYCEDPDAARKTRRKILSQAADTNARVIPAHFGGQHFVWVERDDAAFRPRFEAPKTKVELTKN